MFASARSPDSMHPPFRSYSLSSSSGGPQPSSEYSLSSSSSSAEGNISLKLKEDTPRLSVEDWLRNQRARVAPQSQKLIGPDHYLFNTENLEKKEEDSVKQNPRGLPRFLCCILLFIPQKKKLDQAQTTGNLGKEQKPKTGIDLVEAFSKAQSLKDAAKIIKAVFRALRRFHKAKLSNLEIIFPRDIHILTIKKGFRARFNLASFWRTLSLPQGQDPTAQEDNDTRTVAALILMAIQKSNMTEDYQLQQKIIPKLKKIATSAIPRIRQNIMKQLSHTLGACIKPRNTAQKKESYS